MTRIRGSAAVLAVGLLLAGCGPDSSTPAAGGASKAGAAATSAQADGGGATSQADDGGAKSQDKPGGGDRWCDAVKAFADAVDPLFATDPADHKADVKQARARLNELKAAAPAEIKAQVMTLSEFYAAVIDTTGKSMVEDPAAYARVGSTAKKLETVIPPVSDYTVKHCPGLDKQLPVGNQ
ncbi:hypothetical protein GA0070604_3550 [Micromonospora eburnea]|uniref:Lipoprotein n=2 Tax=Micromonospora eburnea TaxID=227316 RepID=A0A1C6USM9_9ACTN|nr:hypothetical protein GA0070604_3550 [Micromonospora eburnea]